MGRRGWSAAPDGWVPIIRGPRPPAEVWPREGRNVSATHPKPSVAGRAQRVLQGRWRQHQRINPDAAREMAQSTVVRLEKALEAMGDKGPVVEVLKSELTKAKSASRQPPLDLEPDQCRKYIA